MRSFYQDRVNANRIEFIDLIERHAQFEGSRELLPGLRLARANQPTDRVTGVFKPSLCVVAQGAKEIYLGDKAYRYDADRYLIATVEMPMTGKVVRASPAKPYLSIRLELDPLLVGSVMVDSAMTLPDRSTEAKAVYLSELEPTLVEVIIRLLRLLDAPGDRRVMLPLVLREIVFRLLKAEQGERLRHLPMMGAHSNRITQAVEKLRTDYHEQISIEGLASDLGMSPSGFHHHFKSVMDMSPLQFQKLIRLQEARQLMLSESLNASTAGYRVGYDDPSHFSRDYKRQFGEAPMRDIVRLKGLVATD